MTQIKYSKDPVKDKPVIGIIVDLEEDNKGYSRYPWYALRKNYSDCIAECGGIPVLLPYSLLDDVLSIYIDMIDGLMITGGGFDIDPNLYNEPNLYPNDTNFRPSRTEFEKQMLRKALEKKIAVLGICGGMQLINVAFGGTLYQHLPGQWPSNIKHSKDSNTSGYMGVNDISSSQSTSLLEHMISLNSSSKLYEIVGNTCYKVNTSHHQAVKEVGKDLIINARAEDGLIEGIEAANFPFIIGVQWHPEFLSSPEDTAIITGFINNCKHKI